MYRKDIEGNGSAQGEGGGGREMAVRTRMRRLKWQIFPAIKMRYASLSFIKKILAAGIVWRQR